MYSLARQIQPTLLVAVASILACGAFLVTSNTWLRIFKQLSLDGNGGAAILAVAGSAWLLWLGRGRLKLAPPHSSSWLYVLAAFGFFCAGKVGNWVFVEQAGSLGLALSLSGIFFDSCARPILAAVWIALLFALPVPGLFVETFAIPLIYAEARAVEFVALLAGFDVTRDGLIVVLQGTAVRIDEDCSGFALLWPTLLACWLALAGSLRSWGSTALAIKAGALVAAGTTALCANLVRIIITVFAYAYAPVEVAETAHDALGWLLVVSVGAVPFALLRNEDATGSLAAPRIAGSIASLLYHTSGVMAVLLIVLATGLTQAGSQAQMDAGETLAAQLENLPWRLENWVGENRVLPRRELEILGADAVVHRAYVDLVTGEEILLVAAWHSQAADAVGHGALKCYRARGWALNANSSVNLGISGESSERFVFRKSNSRITVFETVLENPVPIRAPGELSGEGGSLRVLIVFNGVRMDDASQRLAGQFASAIGVKSSSRMVGFL